MLTRKFEFSSFIYFGILISIYNLILYKNLCHFTFLGALAHLVLIWDQNRNDKKPEDI